jgi:hypothetical protein
LHKLQVLQVLSVVVVSRRAFKPRTNFIASGLKKERVWDSWLFTEEKVYEVIARLKHSSEKFLIWKMKISHFRFTLFSIQPPLPPPPPPKKRKVLCKILWVCWYFVHHNKLYRVLAVIWVNLICYWRFGSFGLWCDANTIVPDVLKYKSYYSLTALPKR